MSPSKIRKRTGVHAKRDYSGQEIAGHETRRVALETLGFEMVVDPDQPADVISFRDERGVELGRITGLKPEQGDGR